MTAVLTRPEGLPEHTLGYQIIEWIYDHLLFTDGPEAGQPFQLTDEQVTFVLWFYAVDGSGRPTYPRAVLERMKGWGKDFVAAAISIVEWIGPSRFSYWDAAGNPVGERHPASWVEMTAVNEDQALATMVIVAPMLSEYTIQKYGIELGKTQCVASNTNGKIRVRSSSARGAEGARVTFVLRNETHHWVTGNGGHAFAEVISRNVTKARGGGARVLDCTNAYMVGEDSVAERVHDVWRKQTTGRSRGSGLLFDSREADPATDMSDPDSLRKGILEARGDSTWLDVDGIIQEIHSFTGGSDTSARFYLNQKVAARDSWVSAQWWDVCALDDKLEPGTEITLGFDGSRTDDASALLACRVSDGMLFPIKIWEAPNGPAGQGWEIDRQDVDDTVEWSFSTYKVSAFYSDVNEWESYTELWAERHRKTLRIKASERNSVQWDMRGRGKVLVDAAMAFQGAIEDGTALHNGDGVLRQHVLNARRRLAPGGGVTFAKENRESSRKVDAVSAALLARMARQDLVNKGKQRRSTGGQKAVVYQW